MTTGPVIRFAQQSECGPYSGTYSPKARVLVGRFHVDIRDAALIVTPRDGARMRPVGLRVLKAPDGAALTDVMISHAPMIVGPLPLAAVTEPVPLDWAFCNEVHLLQLRFAGEGSVVFELAGSWTNVSGRIDVALRYGYANEWKYAWMYEPEVSWFLGGWG